MYKTLVACVAFLAVLSQAFAFEFTSWTGALNKKEIPKSKCWSDGTLNGRDIPRNRHTFIGSLTTESDTFTLMVDGNPITLPMEPKRKKNPKKSPTKYRVKAPTPGQVAQLELSVQAILRQKLGDSDFVLQTATVKTNVSAHKLKKKFQKVKTQVRLTWTGTSPQGEWSGRLSIEFLGKRGT